MKAVQYATYGDPLEVPQIVEIEAPQPAAGEVQIAIEASPMRFADIYCLKGLPGFRPPLPAVPGGTGIGRVTAAGPGVMTLGEGDRVYLPRAGTWWEYMTCPADKLFQAPSDGDAVALAQVNSNGITAHTLLRHGGDLKPGDWVIQSAGNSNCGRYITQLARRWGIKTVSVVRRATVADELTALGTDVVVVDGEDLGERVAAATDGAEIHLALDMVGGTTTGHMAQCLADDGVIALYGEVGGQTAQVPINLMFFKHLTMYGFLAESRLRQSGGNRSEFDAVYDEVAGLIKAGELRSHIAAVYSFDEYRDAIAHFLEGADGKIIIVPSK